MVVVGRKRRVAQFVPLFHCGAVGYIAGEIPSILGSILGHVTFLSEFYYDY